MSAELYERLGRTYRETRRADPRIAALVEAALGDARSVVNVGAGTGSYEPADRRLVAVEPAAAMRARRPAGAAPCVDASAESLPFDDASVDAAMALYSDFHWSDRARGVAEMMRVARHTVVVLTVDSEAAGGYWLIRDYVPTGAALFAPLRDLLRMLPGADVRPVMIPDDCLDGFAQAFWKRPEALLDPDVRAPMALFERLGAGKTQAAIDRLRADLRDGTWRRRNKDLLNGSAADLGHRLVTWRRCPAAPESTRHRDPAP